MKKTENKYMDGGMLEDGGMIMKIWCMWMDERQIVVSREMTATRKYTMVAYGKR